MTEVIFMVDGIINKGDVVDMFPYIYPVNNIPTENGCVKKVQKCNSGSTTISVKLDVDGLLYHSIPLKYVTKGDTLNRMFSDPRKKR